MGLLLIFLHFQVLEMVWVHAEKAVPFLYSPMHTEVSWCNGRQLRGKRHNPPPGKSPSATVTSLPLEPGIAAANTREIVLNDLENFQR